MIIIMKKKNPIAKSLRSPHLKPKVVKAKKGKGAFKRKK
jgi:stalled ribosome alternative rescue factor ArfA